MNIPEVIYNKANNANILFLTCPIEFAITLLNHKVL